MAKNNEYPKGFIVERVAPVSEEDREKLREQVKSIGRVSVKPHTGANGKRHSGSPGKHDRNR
jgi:hypothetical protein